MQHNDIQWEGEIAFSVSKFLSTDEIWLSDMFPFSKCLFEWVEIK